MIFVICLVIAIIVMAEETSFGAASSVGVTHSRMAPWQQPLRESIILMTAVKISSWTKTVDARIRTDIGDAKMAWRGHWLRHSWHSGRLWHQKTRVHVQLLAIFMEHYRHNYSFFFFFFSEKLGLLFFKKSATWHGKFQTNFIECTFMVQNCFELQPHLLQMWHNYSVGPFLWHKECQNCKCPNLVFSDFRCSTYFRPNVLHVAGLPFLAERWKQLIFVLIYFLLPFVANNRQQLDLKIISQNQILRLFQVSPKTTTMTFKPN